MTRKFKLNKGLYAHFTTKQIEEATTTALRFLYSLQRRNMIIDPKRYIVKREGISYDQFVEQLVFAALSHTDPLEGLVSYWKEVLYPVYGTHRVRTANLDTVQAEEEVVNPLGGFRATEGRPSERPSPSLSMGPSRADEQEPYDKYHVLFRREYGQRDMWPQERKDIIYTWLCTGSPTETAELLGLDYKKVANATERIGDMLYERAAREGLVDIQGEPTEEMRRCCQALVEHLQTE